jgi:phospholipid-binding lipoprotein MlaA
MPAHQSGGAIAALRGGSVALCAAAMLALSACATVPNTSTPPDPLSGFNHAMLKVNDGVETVVAKPVDTVYRAVVPGVARKMLSNARANLNAPVIFANDLLQGQPRRASETFMRFLVNSTVGFGGLIDVASAGNIPTHEEDFGQTLAVWGVGPGPYLVVPLLGPSSLRDLVGTGVDTITDPTFWLIGTPGSTSTIDIAQLGSSTLVAYDDARDDLELLRSSSVDFYEALRNVYHQHRQTEILNGNFVQSDSGDILDTLDSINGN